MDEVFWSNVVKRWSEASENVIRLKKELAALHRERELYVDPAAKSQIPEAGNSQHLEYIRHEDEHRFQANNTQHELYDAEDGLRRAREEYRKMQHDLALSSKRIVVLIEEKEDLCLKHQEEIMKLNQTIERMSTSHSEQRTVQSGMETFSTSDRYDTEQDVVQKSAVISNVNEAFIATLYREIEDLKSSAESREAENEELRHELATVQDKLHKAEENQKSLLGSIVKLQSITRSSVLSTFDHNVVNCNSSRKSLKRTSLSSKASNGENSEAKRTPRIKPSPQMELGDPSPQFHVDDKLTITRNATTVNPSHFPEREKVISRLPAVSYPEIDESENLFERDFLKSALGEGVRSFIEHFSDSQKMDKKTMTSYLCPTLNHHPWCPSLPGQHGFIFVGLGKDKDAYSTPVTRNLFVGLVKRRSVNRSFRYIGKYRVHRVDCLAVEEWNALSHDAKIMYAKLTKEKQKDARSLTDIVLAYDKGELSVPCVRLQYIDFDSQLYAALLSWRKDVRNRC